MDKIAELEQRLNEYKRQSQIAEDVALKKLQQYPQGKKELSPVEVLRRELLRHHTRTLLLNEIKQWIEELKGMRMYQLYSLPDDVHKGGPISQVRQYMTEKEVEEVNATYEANHERLRWKPVDMLERADEESE